MTDKKLAQAEEIRADIFIARDDNCEKVYNLMKDNGLLSFEYLDLRTPPNQFFGELFKGCKKGFSLFTQGLGRLSFTCPHTLSKIKSRYWRLKSGLSMNIL